MFLCSKCHEKGGCKTFHLSVLSLGCCERCGSIAHCVSCTQYDFSGFSEDLLEVVDSHLEVLERIPDRAYKVVRFENGEAQSVYADLMATVQYPVCKYPFGALVVAPTETGIFCFETEGGAIEDVRHDYGTIRDKVGILEVIPLGPGVRGQGLRGIQYPAVIPLRKVWPVPIVKVQKEQEYDWEDITRECKPLFQPHGAKEEGSYILLMYLGWEVCVFDGTLAIKEHIKPREDRPDFRIETWISTRPLVPSSVIARTIDGFRILMRWKKGIRREKPDANG